MKIYHKEIRLALLGILAISILCSCKKSWLEEKSDITLTVPSTIKDLQALLDNSSIFNANGQSLGEVSSDNLYMTPSIWAARQSIDKNAYVWDPNIFKDVQTSPADWNNPYLAVYYSNAILENVSKIEVSESNSGAINNIRGSALFYRSFLFYDLASIFAPAYSEAAANTDAGIPIRLSSDVNELSVRASVQKTYQRIIDDLKQARLLLPITPLYKTRPSVPALFGLLARVYLAMEDYNNASIYADSCLLLNNSLLNFNSLSGNALPQFSSNSEIIFFNGMPSIGTVNSSYVDTTLYRMYANNDLRKSIYFSSVVPTVTFIGNYNSLIPNSKFNGLATDEIYLIKAECLARQGSTQEAMKTLNTLLQSRWKTATFIDYTATNANDALQQILIERRKELLYRGLRWTDLRRLNRDNRFKVTLTRKINSDIYTLPPGDLRYVQLLPPDVIRYSTMPQNPR